MISENPYGLSQQVRQQCFERDRGVCSLCRRDTAQLLRVIKKLQVLAARQSYRQKTINAWSRFSDDPSVLVDRPMTGQPKVLRAITNEVQDRAKNALDGICVIYPWALWQSRLDNRKGRYDSPNRMLWVVILKYGAQGVSEANMVLASGCVTACLKCAEHEVRREDAWQDSRIVNR